MSAADIAQYEDTTSLGKYNYERRSTNSTWQSISGCAACNSGRISPFATIRSFSYDRCDECGFVFANPRPTNEYLGMFYNSSFYNNYRILERERIKVTPYFSISTDAIPMIADWVSDDKNASILDFGCGPGSFLAYLRDRCGFTNLTGLELNQSSVAVAMQAYGLTILSDPSALEGKQFDIVVLIEVIEHVSDVDEVMRAVDRLLRPGGQLIVTTDAVNNPVARHFPAWSPHFTGPSHISLFSSDALARLLNRFAYDIEKSKFAYSHELFGNTLASPFYRLDFLSPARPDDLSDHLFVPTALGRCLGLRPTRALPRLFRAIRRLDSLASRAIASLFGQRFPSHQFVLARKRVI